MDGKELQEIRARSEEVKRLLRPFMQIWSEKDVSKLFAEVEELRAEQEQLRNNIRSLKEERTALIRGAEERLRGIEGSRAVMREVLEYVRGRLSSLNIGESLAKIDLVLSVSNVGHSDGRQIMDDDNTGIDSLQSSNSRRSDKTPDQEGADYRG